MFEKKISKLRRVYFDSIEDEKLKDNINKIDVDKEKIYLDYELLNDKNKLKFKKKDKFVYNLNQNYFRTIEIISEINYLFEVIFYINDKEKLYEYLGAFYLIRSNEILLKKHFLRQTHLSIGEMFRAGAILEYIFDENKKTLSQSYKQIENLIKCLGKEGYLFKYSFFDKNLNLIYLSTLYKIYQDLSKKEQTQKKEKHTLTKEEEILEETIKCICQTFEDYKLIVNSHRFNKNNLQILLNQNINNLIAVGEAEKYPILNYDQKIKEYENILQMKEKFDSTISYLKNKIQILSIKDIKEKNQTSVIKDIKKNIKEKIEKYSILFKKTNKVNP